jgi:hypothetical protein
MAQITNRNPTNEPEAPEFEARVQATQHRLAAELHSSYDFIVCGSGSSGSFAVSNMREEAMQRRPRVWLLPASQYSEYHARDRSGHRS